MSSTFTAAGSSPLTRGKRRIDNRIRRSLRLIPAHAGKTPKAGNPAALSAAHPRSRGENAVARNFSIHRLGSSPLTRGKPLGASGQAFPVGLIPAHAGKTGGGVDVHGFSPAHPRSRGENDRREERVIEDHGSSPLTRGKRTSSSPTRTHRGLIPAHAGKTRWYAPKRPPSSAHPRSRGEN